MEVGGWAWGGGSQGIQLQGDGYTFSSQEVTSGASYQQLAIKNVTAQLRAYEYTCCPSNPFPVVLYTIVMRREVQLATPNPGGSCQAPSLPCSEAHMVRSLASASRSRTFRS